MPDSAPRDGRSTRSLSTIVISKSCINQLEIPGPGQPRRALWDARLKGFGIRVYPSGAIVYVLQYRMKLPGAKTQTLTIGKHGSPWTPDTARDRAHDLLERVRKGVDPAAAARMDAQAVEDHQRAAAEAERHGRHYDFDAFADRYLEQHVQANGLRSTCDIEGTFRRDLRPWFRGKCVLDISTQDVKDMRVHVGRRSRSAANKAHKWLNAAFMWGIEHDGLTSSPMRDLTRPFPEPKRERVLADWEIALVWSILPSLAVPFAMLVRLLLLTGQRLREVAGMRWEEIDLEKGEWVIPSSRTKNKRIHLVPISPQVHRVLTAIEPDPAERQGPVLTTNGRTPISGFSKTKKAIDALVAGAAAARRWSRVPPPRALGAARRAADGEHRVRPAQDPAGARRGGPQPRQRDPRRRRGRLLALQIPEREAGRVAQVGRPCREPAQEARTGTRAAPVTGRQVGRGDPRHGRGMEAK